jgi:hypothetical protein
MYILNDFNKWLLAKTIQIFVPFHEKLAFTIELSNQQLNKDSNVSRRAGKMEFNHNGINFVSVQRYYIEKKNQIVRPKAFCSKIKTNDYSVVLKIGDQEIFAEIISIDTEIHQNQTKIQCHYYKCKLMKTKFEYAHFVKVKNNLKHTDANNIDRKVVSFEYPCYPFSKKKLIIEYY